MAGKRGSRKATNGNGGDGAKVVSLAGEKKKRGRPAKVKPVLDLSNISAETVQRHWKAFHDFMAAEVRRKSESAAKLKAIKEAAKNDGVDPADLAWRYKQSLRSIEEIDAETRRRNRIARFTNLPLGAQPGLFDPDTGASVATKIEDDKMATGSAAMAQTEHEAELGGFNAIDAGLTVDKNPWPKEHANHAAWHRGFVRRAEERAPGDAAAVAGGKPVDDGFEMSATNLADIGGYKAAELGHTRDDNVYPVDDPRHAAWDAGWCRFAISRGEHPEPLATTAGAEMPSQQPTA